MGKNLTRIGIALVITVGMAHSQTKPVARPEFEVASIKRNTGEPGGASFHLSPGGRLDVHNMPLRFLIWNAYELPDYQASGGPNWVDSDRYDIVAKSDNNSSSDGMLLMLKMLLEERFKLTFRHDVREESVFILAIATSGLKMRQTTEASCVHRDRNDSMPQVGSDVPPPIYCGDIKRARLSLDGSGAPVAGTSLNTLAGQLSSILDRPVVDKTGLTGVFDFHLQWTPLPRTPDQDTVLPDSTNAADPSIFSALQEQLGLRLESGKGPVEMLTIDHVERPSEN